MVVAKDPSHSLSLPDLLSRLPPDDVAQYFWSRLSPRQRRAYRQLSKAARQHAKQCLIKQLKLRLTDESLHLLAASQQATWQQWHSLHAVEATLSLATVYQHQSHCTAAVGVLYAWLTAQNTSVAQHWLMALWSALLLSVPAGMMMAAYQQMKHLQTLFATLALQNPCLTTLHIRSDNSWNDETVFSLHILRTILQPLRQLRHLDICLVWDPTIGEKALRALCYCPMLTSLKLDVHNVLLDTGIPEWVLQEMPLLAQLTHLDLRLWQSLRFNLNQYYKLAQPLPSLTSLVVSLYQGSLSQLMPLIRQHTQLVSLCLHTTRYSNNDSDQWDWIASNLGRLQKLCFLYGSSMPSMSQLAQLTALQDLRLPRPPADLQDTNQQLMACTSLHLQYHSPRDIAVMGHAAPALSVLHATVMPHSYIGHLNYEEDEGIDVHAEHVIEEIEQEQQAWQDLRTAHSHTRTVNLDISMYTSPLLVLDVIAGWQNVHSLSLRVAQSGERRAVVFSKLCEAFHGLQQLALSMPCTDSTTEELCALISSLPELRCLDLSSLQVDWQPDIAQLLTATQGRQVLLIVNNRRLSEEEVADMNRAVLQAGCDKLRFQKEEHDVIPSFWL